MFNRSFYVYPVFFRSFQTIVKFICGAHEAISPLHGDKNLYISNATSMLVAYNAGKAVILDVRPDAQRALGYIEGSLHIPMAALLNSMSPKFENPETQVITQPFQGFYQLRPKGVRVEGNTIVYL